MTRKKKEVEVEEWEPPVPNTESATWKNNTRRKKELAARTTKEDVIRILTSISNNLGSMYAVLLEDAFLTALDSRQIRGNWIREIEHMQAHIDWFKHNMDEYGLAASDPLRYR